MVSVGVFSGSFKGPFCPHAFNMLDARGAISVTERAHYIGRVRNLSKLCAEAYVAQREERGYPLGNALERRTVA